MLRTSRRPPPSAATVAAGLALAVLLGTQPVIATAQVGGPETLNTVRSFDLAPRPLGQALNDWAMQTGMQLIVQPSLVNDRSAPAVAGELTPRQALERLLAGTGLTARIDGAAVIVEQRPASQSAPAPGAATTLPAVTVRAQGERNATSEGTGLYAPQAVTVGKSAQSLREIPQSVSVITRQQIEDQGLISLADVMRRAPGVVQTDGPWRASYSARGLSIGNVRYEGGGVSSFYSGELDTALYDHIAVVRGPDGLFGAADAGGVINLSLKRPQRDARVRVSMTGGSWKFLRAELDATGPIALDGRVRGRVVAVRQDRNRFYQPGQQDHSLIYGGVETDLTPDTVLFAAAYNQVSHQVGLNRGLPRYSDGSDIGLPRNLGVGLPWANTRRETTEGFAQLRHRFSADWRAQFNLRAIYEMQYWRMAYLGGPVDPNTRLANWISFPEDAAAHDLNIDFHVNGSFGALGRRHDLVVGVDAGRRTGFSGYGDWDFGDRAQTDIFRPFYPPEGSLPLTSWDFGSDRSDSRNLYGSLRLRPIDDLAVIVGGRYVLKDASSNYNDAGTETSRREEGKRVVPYLGAIYDLNQALSVYASSSEIYQSQARSFQGPPPGRPLDPVKGRNVEIGIKGEWDRRLVASAALYRTEKKGAAAVDPAWPTSNSQSLAGSCCFIGTGNQLSQGVELEVSGEIARGWQVSAGYTYNSNHDRRDDDARFSTITPKHLFKAWVDYAFSGKATGLRLGGGVLAQSSSFQSGTVNAFDPATQRYSGAPMDYRFTQAGYGVWFLNGEYALSRNWTVQLNLNNLFDKSYYNTVSGTWGGNYYGEPRSAFLTLKGTY